MSPENLLSVESLDKLSDSLEADLTLFENLDDCFFPPEKTDLAGSSLEEAADSSIEDDSWCSYLL